jgi:hypothetical protein
MKKFLIILVPFVVLTLSILFEGWICIGICLLLLLIDTFISIIIRRHKTPNIYTTKIKQTNMIPKDKMIMFYDTLYINKETFTNEELNHKVIHKIQGFETGFLFMYVLYLIEYVVKLFVIGFRNKFILMDNSNIFKQTFNSISFEQEVHDIIEINKRPNYNWVKYIFKING